LFPAKGWLGILDFVHETEHPAVIYAFEDSKAFHLMRMDGGMHC